MEKFLKFKKIWKSKEKKEKEIPRNTPKTNQKTNQKNMYKSLPFQVKMIEHIIVISYAIMILMNLCEKWRSSNSMGRSNTASATFSSDSLQ